MADEKKDDALTYEVKGCSYRDTAAVDGAHTAVGLKRRSLAPAAPDDQSPAVTGRYEALGDDVVCHINQAGPHIQIWLGRFPTGGKGALTPERFAGDLRPGGGGATFQLYKFDDPGCEPVGTLTASGSPLLLSLSGAVGGGEFRLGLQSEGATLSESALEKITDDAVLATNEYFPLTSSMIERIERDVVDAGREEDGTPQTIPEHLNEFFGLANNNTISNMNRWHCARRLDTQLKSIHDLWHPKLRPLVLEHMSRVLHQQRYTHEGTDASVWYWLEAIVNLMREYGGRDVARNVNRYELPFCEGLLKMVPDEESDDRYVYRMTMLVIGLEGKLVGGLGGYFGACTIDRFECKASECDSPGKVKIVYETKTRSARLEYTVWFGGGSGGLAAGVKFGHLIGGTAVSSHEYAQNDLKGGVQIFEASAGGSWGVGGSIGETAIVFTGSGRFSALPFSTDLLSGEAGLASGAGVGAYFGYAHGTKDRTIPDPFVPDDRDHAVETKMQADVHFHLGDSHLTERGRQLVRVFCAIELASLSSATSELSYYGHADRVDTKDRNYELTRFRAKNVKQAVKDVSGTAFAVEDREMDTVGWGEIEASMGPKPDLDGVENPQARRVEVILNSRLIARMYGR